MKYGQCKIYGFSLVGYLRTLILRKHGFLDLLIYLPKEKSEEEE